MTREAIANAPDRSANASASSSGKELNDLGAVTDAMRVLRLSRVFKQQLIDLEDEEPLSPSKREGKCSR